MLGVLAPAAGWGASVTGPGAWGLDAAVEAPGGPAAGLGPFAPGPTGTVRAEALSANWAGFIDGARSCTTSATGVCPSGQTFSGASATFVVPELPVPQPRGYVASWAGVGGVFGTGALLQAGTIEVVSGRATATVGFWEDYPNPPTYFGFGKVSPGDMVTVGVSGVGATPTVTFTDATSGLSLIVDPESALGGAFVAPDTETGEWILEDPSCGGGSRLCPFADFSPEEFTTEAATFTGTASAPLESILVDAAGQPEVAIDPSSLPASLGTPFTVTRLVAARPGPGRSGGPGGPPPGPGHPGHGPGGPPPGPGRPGGSTPPRAGE